MFPKQQSLGMSTPSRKGKESWQKFMLPKINQSSRHSAHLLLKEIAVERFRAYGSFP